jgi:hypothetical protein
MLVSYSMYHNVVMVWIRANNRLYYSFRSG